MMRRWQSFMISICAVVCTQSVFAAGPEPIKLWPDGAPGATGEGDKHTPLVRVYQPEEMKTGTAVVILPGGGYGGLAMDHEGQQIAKWWNRLGVTGLVVTYRHAPEYQHPAPMQDAQRAIRYARANAEDLGIDPQRVGVMGFSAGGHLASTVSTHFDEGDKDSSDIVAQQNCRPDFSILCYPVISMLDPDAHKGSRRNLLGENPSEELVQNLSNHLQVTAQTPPTFIFHTEEDPVVPVKNALLYYTALIDHGVNAELHVYQKGRHGVGLAPNDPILKSWPDRLADWMRSNNFLSGQSRAAISGKVNVNGQPLSWGMIGFVSLESPNLPSAGTLVSGGNFSLPQQDGLIPGSYAVTVSNMGTFARIPALEDAVDLTGDASRTAVRALINDDQPHTFDFELQSP